MNLRLRFRHCAPTLLNHLARLSVIYYVLRYLYSTSGLRVFGLHYVTAAIHSNYVSDIAKGLIESDMKELTEGQTYKKFQ